MAAIPPPGAEKGQLFKGLPLFAFSWQARMSPSVSAPRAENPHKSAVSPGTVYIRFDYSFLTVLNQLERSNLLSSRENDRETRRPVPYSRTSHFRSARSARGRSRGRAKSNCT